MIIQKNPLADDSAGGILFYMPMPLGYAAWLVQELVAHRG